MATRLKEYIFRAKTRAKYPWADWFDGSIWSLVRGEDYATITRHFTVTVHQAAKRRGTKVRTSSTDGGLVIQAYDG